MPVETRKPTIKPSRGPLRAIHPVPYSPVQPQWNIALNNECRKNNARDENPKTPILRSRCNISPEAHDNPEYIRPLRTSSCRAAILDQCLTRYPSEDIRCHFPIRGLRVKLDEDRTKQDASKWPECVERRPSRKRVYDSDSDYSLLAKQSRCEQTPSESDQSVHLTMGAEVRTHPRYCRRRSVADGEHRDSVRRLSPICPVPMPTGFPVELPTTLGSVQLPWDADKQKQDSMRTVETQTSPTANIDEVSTPKSQSRHGRRSGSFQVLSTLRKTIGSLKRAISADRLNKIAPETDQKPINPKSPIIKNRVSLRSRRASDVSSIVSNNSEASQKIPVSRSSETYQETLKCEVIARYKDGSMRVALRRASTSEQFGFFIARDSQGIYISRLGSVRYAVKFWDIFHVGDRILEVQGVPCTSIIGVDQVQNLIRGCELAEFRIKPAQSNPSLRSTRSQ